MSNTKKAARSTELEPATEATAETEATLQPVEVEFNEKAYTMDADAFDDILLLRDLRNMDNAENGVGLAASVIERLLGDEQFRRFCTEQSNEKGRLQVESAFKFLEVAVGKLGASQSS